MRTDAWQHNPLPVFAALFIATSLLAGGVSGNFLEADAYAHFLYAESAWRVPSLFTDVWGRPFCTGLYALIAPWGGMAGCRAMSLLLVLLCAEFTRQASAGWFGKEFGDVAALLVLAQPMLWLQSMSVMTELPFAAILSLAMWMLVRRGFFVAMLAIGLLPLTRPEGFAFAVVGFAWALMGRRWIAAVVVIVPTLMWNFLGAFLNGSTSWIWLIESWPYSQRSSYGAGHFLQFVALLPIAVGPLVMPFVLAGIVTSRRDRRVFGIAATAVTLTVGHSVLWSLGLMASFGEIRYLSLAAPLWAVLGGWGWVRLRDLPGIRHVPIVALAGVGVGLVFGARITWIRETPETTGVKAAARWIVEHRPSAMVVSSHPGVWVHAGIQHSERARFVSWDPAEFGRLPAGSILVWDPRTGTMNARQALTADVAQIETGGWHEVATFSGGRVVFEKR